MSESGFISNFCSTFHRVEWISICDFTTIAYISHGVVREKLPEIKKLEILEASKCWTKLHVRNIIDEVIAVQPSRYQNLQKKTFEGYLGRCYTFKYKINSGEAEGVKSAVMRTNNDLKNAHIWEGVEPQVQSGDTGGIRALQERHEYHQGRHIVQPFPPVPTCIMVVATEIDYSDALLQNLLRPRKVFDLGQLAVATHGLHQLLPLVGPEQVAPASSGDLCHAARTLARWVGVLHFKTAFGTTEVTQASVFRTCDDWRKRYIEHTK